MTSTKTLIEDAVRSFPVAQSPAWQRFADGDAALQPDHIEPEAGTINTTDCLFDGKATIVLRDARAVHAIVFGRFDSRRAEVDRILIDG